MNLALIKCLTQLTKHNHFNANHEVKNAALNDTREIIKCLDIRRIVESPACKIGLCCMYCMQFENVKLCICTWIEEIGLHIQVGVAVHQKAACFLPWIDYPALNSRFKHICQPHLSSQP